MTVVPLRRRPAPLNHSAYPCTGCRTPSLAQHTRDCRETPRQRPGLAVPDAARVVAGLLVGIPLGAALWLAAAAIALIAWRLA